MFSLSALKTDEAVSIAVPRFAPPQADLGNAGILYGQDRRSVRRPTGFPASAVRNSGGAITCLRKWLAEKPRQEDRNVEEIPCVELDAYLEEFFTTIKKQDGSTYQPNSLKAVRQGIEFYLKERGYGYSITNSPVFVKSQYAFKKKTRELVQAGGTKMW